MSDLVEEVGDISAEELFNTFFGGGFAPGMNVVADQSDAESSETTSEVVANQSVAVSSETSSKVADKSVAESSETTCEDWQTERWQKDTRSLLDGIMHIHQTKELSDCNFKVGNRTFKAHRLILAARSPEFLNMFLKNPSPTSIDCKDIDEITEDGMEILLKYMYTDQVDDLDQEKLLKAYRTASYYKQKGLLKVCEDRIAEWQITCENVCTLLNELSDIESMKQRCLVFIKNNALSVLTAESLTEASLNTLWLMFESGFFKHAPAMTRLKSALRWALHQLPEQKDYKVVRELLLSKPILGRCGIQKLNNSELSTVIAQYKDLLSPEECTTFFVNANSPGAMPLPAWCESEE